MERWRSISASFTGRDNNSASIGAVGLTQKINFTVSNLLYTYPVVSSFHNIAEWSEKCSESVYNFFVFRSNGFGGYTSTIGNWNNARNNVGPFCVARRYCRFCFDFYKQVERFSLIDFACRETPSAD